MTTYHRVFKSQSWEFVADIPFDEKDDNQGLPEWYFDGDFFNPPFFAVIVSPEEDTVEWVPDCGPAPCWKAKLSEFRSNEALIHALEAWCRANY